MLLQKKAGQMSYDQETNPYAAPEVLDGPMAQQGGDPYRFYVDGNLIMCGRVVTLPEVCVRTGAREDLALMQKRIVHVPGWCYIGLIGGLIPLLILYLIFKKECSANYFLARKVRNKLRWRIFFGIMSILLTPFVMAIGATMNDLAPVFIFGGFGILITGFVLLVMGSAPLSISRHDRGTTFWLKGAKPEFFDELRRMYNA